MSEANDRAVETVDEDPHEGGFRAHAAITTDRGGPRYGEFSEQVRLLMDNARYATQVHGGYGFMNEFPVGRFYRDAKILEIGEGTSEVQRMLIARSLGVA